MFIQTEATGDPARLKFLPGREVLAEGTLDLRDPAQAARSPLAERLFAIPGVRGVSLGRDFIVVTKADGDWQYLKPMILGAIMDHFTSQAPVLREDAAGAGDRPAGGGTDIRDRVVEALRGVIDPELGYNIVDLGLVYDVAVAEDGAVRVTMTTTTPGCPATNYLKQGAGASVSAVPGVERVEVNLVHQPRWSPDMMSPEAKAHFGMRGRRRW
ncbi:MAG: NifU N-terminal domain-containing protein [Rhodospirillaceae bacterium]|nr:NifU N-terminal domain-containing protein [Rhodospirillaceae bacterium]